MIRADRALPGRASKMAAKDRHRVLDSAMEGTYPAHLSTAVLATGCFCGAEKGMWRLPGGGIHTTAVGYCAGFTPNPTYDEVCSGRTGHAEAVLVVYDPAKISFVDSTLPGCKPG